MHDDHTTEAMEQARMEYERKQFQDPEKYTPRPRWQSVFAWALIAIVILGIINLCYLQMTLS